MYMPNVRLQQRRRPANIFRTAGAPSALAQLPNWGRSLSPCSRPARLVRKRMTPDVIAAALVHRLLPVAAVVSELRWLRPSAKLLVPRLAAPSPRMFQRYPAWSPRRWGSSAQRPESVLLQLWSVSMRRYVRAPVNAPSLHRGWLHPAVI